MQGCTNKKYGDKAGKKTQERYTTTQSQWKRKTPRLTHTINMEKKDTKTNLPTCATVA